MNIYTKDSKIPCTHTGIRLEELESFYNKINDRVFAQKTMSTGVTYYLDLVNDLYNMGRIDEAYEICLETEKLQDIYEHDISIRS